MSPNQDRDLRAARDRVARLRDSAAGTSRVGAANAVSLAKELAELASMLGAYGEYPEAAASAVEALGLASTSQALVTVQGVPEERPGDAVVSPDAMQTTGPASHLDAGYARALARLVLLHAVLDDTPFEDMRAEVAEDRVDVATLVIPAWDTGLRQDAAQPKVRVEQYDWNEIESLYRRYRNLVQIRRFPEAEGLIEDLIAMLRRVAPADDWAEAMLAAALGDFAGMRHDMGKEFAFSAGCEAVERKARLATAQPGRHLDTLAQSLANLQLMLDDQSHTLMTLRLNAELVWLHRRLAADDGDRFDHELAATLNDAQRLFKLLNRREQALPAILEEVEVYRRLVARGDATHRPLLAAGLNNAGVALMEAGRHTEALAATADAVTTYRELAGAGPEHHRGLALGLWTYAEVRLAAAAELPEAATAIDEAVALYRGLNEPTPDDTANLDGAAAMRDDVLRTLRSNAR
ncbi:hypothetical protein [Krasilnikovia sp. MM14-A1259]|uniref:hypothetical protein n=1 Tax=Krasilnikovia sp. MM14-A1259 TaxID=3373539 RepID=UPI0037FA3C7A